MIENINIVFMYRPHACSMPVDMQTYTSMHPIYMYINLPIKNNLSCQHVYTCTCMHTSFYLHEYTQCTCTKYVFTRPVYTYMYNVELHMCQVCGLDHMQVTSYTSSLHFTGCRQPISIICICEHSVTVHTVSHVHVSCNKDMN